VAERSGLAARLLNVKILVRATNWLGDAVMSLPALRALRTRFPDAQITVLARPWVASLYEGERSIDVVIPLQGAAGPRDWKLKWQMVRLLRRERFDLAVLLPNSFESAAIAWLSGARRRVGYARDGRSVLLTDAVAVPRPGEIARHERYYYPELLRRAGLIGEMPEVKEILLDGLDESRMRGETLFAARGVSLPVIGVSPGAAYGAAKRWLPDRFAATAHEIAGVNGASLQPRATDTDGLRASVLNPRTTDTDGLRASIAVFGSESERELCGEVAGACGGYNFAGLTTLRAFIDMSAACSLCLTNDSGAMHIAAAVGVPCVTVFGPTDEIATGPTGRFARVVREPVECAPCKLRECPIDHRCMNRVTAERVVRIATDSLKS
jgi:heptosyltransferase-2